MAATIYQFPTPSPQEPKYRIPLFTEEEIEVTIISVNVFSQHDIRYNKDTLNFIDAVTVMECLKSSIVSKIFSERFKSVARNILKNVEKV